MRFKKGNKLKYRFIDSRICDTTEIHSGIPSTIDFIIGGTKEGEFTLCGFGFGEVGTVLGAYGKGKICLVDLTRHQKTRLATFLNRRVVFVCKKEDFTSTIKALENGAAQPFMDFSSDEDYHYIKFITEKTLKILGMSEDTFKFIIVDKDYADRWERKRNFCRDFL